MRNALTVDVEEWFQVCRAERYVPRATWNRLESRLRPSLERLLRLFEARRVRATFFVLGFVAERTPGAVSDIASAGHEIGLHGHSHERADDQGPERFESDLVRGMESVGRLAPAPIRGYRAPEWSLTRRTPWAFEILAAHAFDYDSSYLPLRLGVGNGLARRPHVVKTARGPVVEMPLSTFGSDVVHGPLGNGTAVRLLPGRFVARRIAALNHSGVPAVLCVHPWEMDPGQPRIRLPLFRGAAHYVRLGALRGKLDALLERFEWTAMGEVVKEVRGRIVAGGVSSGET